MKNIDFRDNIELIDISVVLQESMPTYSGDIPFETETAASIKDGDVYNLKKIKMSTHTGTHLDPPRHYVADGEDITQIPLERFLIPVHTVEIRDKEFITAEDLKKIDLNEDTEGILLKTDNSYNLSYEEEFSEEYVSLSECGADYLIEKGIKLIGIDYLSIESYFTKTQSVHKKLLNNRILILETINLRDTEPGEYLLSCFPILIKDGDGSPCRAVLIKKK